MKEQKSGKEVKLFSILLGSVKIFGFITYAHIILFDYTKCLESEVQLHHQFNREENNVT